MYDIENLYEASSVGDAIRLLTEHPSAHIIAGGSDVLIKIREGKLAGCDLVSIHSLDELRGVTMSGEGTIRIGALTSFSHIAKDPIVLAHIPVLAGAVSQVGGPQIRNIGTIGGNVCNGVTSADSASTLFALDAQLVIEGPKGARIAPIDRHYLSAGKVDLRPGEVLTAILIRKASYENCAGHYIKYSMRKAMDIATLGCAVVVRLNEDRRLISEARLAFGVAGPVPVRCPSAEAAAKDQPLTRETFLRFGEAALTDIHPRTSWRASKEFRMQLAQELSARALKEAARKAGGAVDGD